MNEILRNKCFGVAYIFSSTNMGFPLCFIYHKKLNGQGRFFKLTRHNSSNETSFPNWLAMEPPRHSLTYLLIGNDLQPLGMTFNARLSQQTNNQANMDSRVFYLGNVSGPPRVLKIIYYLIKNAFSFQKFHYVIRYRIFYVQGQQEPIHLLGRRETKQGLVQTKSAGQN